MNTQDASAIIDGAISKMDLLIAENQQLTNRVLELEEFADSVICHGPYNWQNLAIQALAGKDT